MQSFCSYKEHFQSRGQQLCNLIGPKKVTQEKGSAPSLLQHEWFGTSREHDRHFIVLTAAGLAQTVERLTVEREVVAGSIPRVWPILRVLKQLRNEGIAFAPQTARPSCDLDDYVKWQSVPSPEGEAETESVSSISSFVPNTLWHSFK